MMKSNSHKSFLKKLNNTVIGFLAYIAGIVVFLFLLSYSSPINSNTVIKQRKYSYYWGSLFVFQKDPHGKILNKPEWSKLHPFRRDGSDFIYPDIYEFTKNDDTIKFYTPVNVGSNGKIDMLFHRVDVGASKWKPKPNYGSLYYIGTYEDDSLRGLIFTYYGNKERTVVCQKLYTNPGNLTGVSLLAKDSENIFEKEHIEIGQADEVEESTRINFKGEIKIR